MPRSPAPDLEPLVALQALVALLARELVPLVAAELRGANPTPRYATAAENPLGSARAFLDAGRRGDFATFKRGRTVVAIWSDVERYIESRRCPTRQPPDEDREELRAAGVQLRLVKGSRSAGGRR